MADEEHLAISTPTSAPTPSERELFAMVYRRMTALAGPGAPDLDDLVQIAAEQVFQNLPSFDGRSELLTWVYTICYRVLLRQRRWYRRWQARFTLQRQELVVASDEPSAAATLEAREDLAERQRALDHC